MVNGNLVGPASQDVFADPVPIIGADPGLVSALRLPDRVLDPFAGILPVMPGRA
jgi:hypothetical protein